MSKILPGSPLYNFYIACLAHVPGPEIDNYEASIGAITNGNTGPLLAELAHLKGWTKKFDFGRHFTQRITVQCDSGEKTINCSSGFLEKFGRTVEYVPKNTLVAPYCNIIADMSFTNTIKFLDGIQTCSILLGKVWEILPHLLEAESIKPKNSTTFFPVLINHGEGNYETIMVLLKRHDNQWTLDISPYSTGLLRVGDQIIYTPR